MFPWELLLVTCMATETTRGRELTQLVSYHVLGNVDRDELVTIMNCNCMSHEIGGNH